MSTDGGLISNIESWFVATLAALEYEDALVFKTADHWRHQVGAVGGGTDAFLRYSPFAFVAYHNSDSAREGGHDLREVPEIHILVGTYNDSPGAARIGDATHLGVSLLRDLVLAAFESKTIYDLGCDEVYYIGDQVVVDAEKYCVIEMIFELSKMTPNK